MAKKVIAYVKLQIPAGAANPSPPVGPALGQHGVNIMAFCKEFNARTQGMDPTDILPVLITIFQDKSFTFILKSVPASVQLKKMAGLKKGSAEPNKNKVGQVTYQQVLEIAQRKAPDLTGAGLDAMARTICGTARSMGIEVHDDRSK